MPDGSLLVSAERSAEETRGMVKVVDARGLNLDEIIREVVSAYRAGYDSIVVFYGESELELPKRLIEECKERLADLMVVAEKPSMIVFSIASSSRPDQLSRLMTLMVKNILEMTEDLVENAKKENVEKLKEIYKRDSVVDKIYFMVAKILSKTLSGEASLAEAGLKSYAEVLHFYHAVKTLERISDHICSASCALVKLYSHGEKLANDALLLMEDTARAERDMLNALLKLDVRQAKSVASLSENIKKKLEKYLIEESNTDKHSVLLDLHRITSYLLDIAEIVIDVNSVREFVQLKTKYLAEMSKIGAESR